MLPFTATDLGFLTRLPQFSTPRSSLQECRCRSRTEEARGSNPLTSTPTTRRSERRRSHIGGALVVPRTAWGHTGATAGLPVQPNDGALGGRLGGAVERVQAVTERRIGLRV